MTAPSSFLEKVSWRMVLDVGSRGIFFLINVLIARALGASDFGKFATAVVITQIFYVFTDMGIGPQLVKEQGQKWADYFELKLVLLFGTTLLFCCAGFFFWQWDRPWLLFLAFVWMLSNSLLDFNQFVCNGLGRIDVARDVMVVQRLFVLAGVAISLLFFPTLPGVLIGLSLGSVIGSLVSNWRSHRTLGMSVSWRGKKTEWKRIFITAFPLGVGAAFGLWYIRIGGIIMAWYWAAQTVGEYSAAFRVFEISYLFPAAIMSISVPHLSAALQVGRDTFMKKARRLAAGMVGAALAWGVFLYVGAPFVTRMLYGERFIAAAPYLALLGIAGALVFLTYLVTNLMVVLDLQKRHALNEGLAFIVGFLLNVVLVPTHGGFGAAYALIGAESFRLVITSASLLRQWRLGRRAVWRPGEAS